MPGGYTILIYCDAISRTDANEILAKQAHQAGGILIASFPGHHSNRVLHVAWGTAALAA